MLQNSTSEAAIALHNHLQLTLERYVQAKHLLVTLTGESTGLIDPLLQERGLKRRIAATVNQFAVAPQLVINSDLIAILKSANRSIEWSRKSTASDAIASRNSSCTINFKDDVARA